MQLQPHMKMITEFTSIEDLLKVRYFLQIHVLEEKNIPVVWYTVDGIKGSNDSNKRSVTVGQNKDHNFILDFKRYRFYSIEFVGNSTHFITN